MYYQGYNTAYSYGSPCCCGGGYPAYGGYGGYGGGFALILVLFILLVIIIGTRPFFGPGPVV